MTPIVHVFGTFIAERDAQEQAKKNGKFKYTCADPDMQHTECFVVLLEEIGEAATALYQQRNVGDGEFMTLITAAMSLGETARRMLNLKRLAKDPDVHQPDRDLRMELTQCGAVITAWLQGFNDKTS